jgi:hypothetical protein
MRLTCKGSLNQACFIALERLDYQTKKNGEHHARRFLKELKTVY